jgi:hypothetical protein
VGGHLTSLLNYRYKNVTVPQGSFHLLFYKDSTATGNDKLIDSSRLIMPSNVGVKAFVGMFNRCTQMTTTPVLTATTLAERCYENLFVYCTNISSITTYANDNSATGCTSNWLLYAASTGTLHNLGSATYTADSASGIPTGWTEVNN